MDSSPCQRSTLACSIASCVITSHGRRRILPFNVTSIHYLNGSCNIGENRFPFELAPLFLIFDPLLLITVEFHRRRSLKMSPVRTSFESPGRMVYLSVWVESLRRDIAGSRHCREQRHLKLCFLNTSVTTTRTRTASWVAEGNPRTTEFAPTPPAGFFIRIDRRGLHHRLRFGLLIQTQLFIHP